MRWLDSITNSMDMSLSKLRGVGDGQGGLACCSPWGRRELDTTERPNNNGISDVFPVHCAQPFTETGHLVLSAHPQKTTSVSRHPEDIRAGWLLYFFLSCICLVPFPQLLTLDHVLDPFPALHSSHLAFAIVSRVRYSALLTPSSQYP